MQRLAQQLAELLMRNIRRMLKERPAESDELRLHRTLPAIAADLCSRDTADARPDSLWGELKDMQRFCERPAEHLMRHLEKMLEERPAELVELLLHRLSPAFAELLTSKLEEHAAQPDGE